MLVCQLIITGSALQPKAQVDVNVSEILMGPM
jgi:hypothetical protein